MRINREALISEFRGEAYPTAVEVGDRLRRNWIIRTRDRLPSDAALGEMEQSLEDEAFKVIMDAYSSSVGAQELARVRPLVALARLGERHLVVRTEFAPPERSIGDAAAIAQWGVLVALDRRLPLEELQGLPCEQWFFLRAAREGRPSAEPPS